MESLMKVTIFSAHNFEKPFLEQANKSTGFEMKYFEAHLNPEVAKLAAGSPVVSAFVSDQLDRQTLKVLSDGGTKMIALRSAGFNHVDLQAAQEFGIKVTRVPNYSPHAIAEHAIALMLTLNRKTHKAYNRAREGNFSLEGLMGFDLAGKTAGIVGTGSIGKVLCQILLGFGCKVVAYDKTPNQDCVKMGVEYVGFNKLLETSDIISLHCPLTPETKYLIDEKALKKAKKGLMLINTGRGGLIDTKAAISALKSGKIAHLGLDVYEEEENLFFEDQSEHIIEDEVFLRLMTFPNVLITGHQGFFTSNAVECIAKTTIENIKAFALKQELENQIIV